MHLKNWPVSPCLLRWYSNFLIWLKTKNTSSITMILNPCLTGFSCTTWYTQLQKCNAATGSSASALTVNDTTLRYEAWLMMWDFLDGGINEGFEWFEKHLAAQLYLNVNSVKFESVESLTPLIVKYSINSVLHRNTISEHRNLSYHENGVHVCLMFLDRPFTENLWLLSVNSADPDKLQYFTSVTCGCTHTHTHEICLSI